MSNPKPTARTAVIIGAGPAGLTAAYELLRRTDVHPIVFERDTAMGGISRTVEHNGNRIDIGGHRFFSKADRVMDWWFDFLPMQKLPEGQEVTITYQRKERSLDGTEEAPDPDTTDRVMLIRSRRSRIYFRRTFFDYPISLSVGTLFKLGLWHSVKIMLSYLKSMALPIRDPKNLEDFFVNRFGRVLYETFFKSYTEKVWGVPCTQISAEWGAQRIKGLSIARAILHFLRGLLPKTASAKQTETSLIEQFLYPKHGPGQMWDVVAEEIRALGGEIRTGCSVDGLTIEDGQVRAVEVTDLETGDKESVEADMVFSTTDIKHLVRGLGEAVPEELRGIAEGLVFRDFLTVGLLVDELRIREKDGSLIQDTWIYIQEPDVKVGRLQIFNNWSPYMVADPSKVWIGLEYFCDEGDEIWSMDDEELIRFGAAELEKIDVLDTSRVRDGVVLRVPKTYPAYFGTYDRFGELRDFLDGIPNLYLVGRNGMHRYNNQDHSMLAAMTAVDLIAAGRTDKSALWEVNAEEEYHEEKG